MNDRYKTLMERSFKDAYYLAEAIEEEYDMNIPEESYPSMALNLYQHRVQEYRKKVAQMEQQSQYPSGDPSIGRQ